VCVCVWTVFFEVNDLWPISLARWFLLNLSCLKVNFVGHSPRSRIKMLLFLPIDAVRWLKSGSKVGKTSCTALQYRKCSECCCSGRLLVESFVLKWSMPVSLLVLAVLLQFLLYPCKCSVFYKQLNDWLIDCLIDWRNLGWGHCGTNVVCSCALYNFVTSLPGGAWGILTFVSVGLRVCVSVRSHISKITFSVLVTCGRGSVLLWQ